MNILLVNHYAGSPVLGMEFRPYYLGREWVRSGNKVMIVGGSYSHLRKQQPTAESETIEGIEYRWIPLKPYKGNGLGRIRSMFDFVRKLRFSYKKILGDFKPDVVIASSTYPLDIYPCKHIADHYKAKLVYEVHDLWPLSPMELGGYSKYHPFIMVMQAAEDYCYRHADKVVSLLPAALPHMVERGMDPKKFVCVPNGFDPQEWQLSEQLPEQHLSLLRSLKKEGRFIILYVGGHAISNALDTLLDAAKRVKNPAVAIILVGNGQEKERLIRRCSDEKIANVFSLPPVEKHAVPALLAEADALYIGWEANPLYRFGISPNKLVDYMMSAKPIIHSVTAANDPVKESGCGISVAAGDINGVKEAIEDMSKTTPDILAEMGRKGHEFATEHWNYQKLSKSFISPPPHYDALSNIYPSHYELFERLKSDNSFIIGFAGAHGIANSLYTLLDAARSLEKYPDIQIVLIGTGQEKNNLIEYAKNHGINNVHFLSPVEKMAIPLLLSMCDVLYIGLQRQPLFRFGISPNKMFDYMMAGRPVIQAIEAGNNLVEEAQCGIAVEPENAEAVCEAILKLKRLDTEAREIMGINGRNFALTNHAYPVLASKFINALK